MTGATGYIARHIIQQALDAGYSVVGTARSAEKVYKLEKDIKNPKFRGHIAELTTSWGWKLPCLTARRLFIVPHLFLK